MFVSRRLLCFAVLLAWGGAARGEDEADASPKRPRVLLLWQKPDGHPEGTHAYQDGVRLLAGWLKEEGRATPVIEAADEPWVRGPELLDEADGAVVFLAEGAAWLSRSPERLKAFERLAARKGGLTCLHWGMGTKTAEPIGPFVRLFGACHGGTDRKYRFLTTTLRPSATAHPITRDFAPLEIRDEFYFNLKRPEDLTRWTSLMEARIDDRDWPVAWAWERPDGGRSFGFSGLHFHENWGERTYRRLVVRGILWSVGQELPERREPSLPTDSAGK